MLSQWGRVTDQYSINLYFLLVASCANIYYSNLRWRSCVTILFLSLQQREKICGVVFPVIASNDILDPHYADWLTDHFRWSAACSGITLCFLTQASFLSASQRLIFHPGLSTDDRVTVAFLLCSTFLTSQGHVFTVQNNEFAMGCASLQIVLDY